MIERKLFEKVDDNPGDYFGMLVEGYDSTYASVMKQADSDAQKLRDSWEKDGKSLFDTLSELGYESDYEDSPYMFKDADGGNTIVFDFRPINSFEDYVTYYVVDKDNRIPDGWTKTKLMIDFWKDKNESLKEDSEYKTLAKLSKGLEVISYPYGYAVSDGYASDRFVVRDGKYIFDDGRFHLSDKDKEKILSLIKKGVVKESLKEDKFVSRDKMSKKDRKELDSKKRNTWGNTNPVTKVQQNKKAYDRKRDKKELDESFETDVFNGLTDDWKFQYVWIGNTRYDIWKKHPVNNENIACVIYPPQPEVPEEYNAEIYFINDKRDSYQHYLYNNGFDSFEDAEEWINSKIKNINESLTKFGLPVEYLRKRDKKELDEAKHFLYKENADKFREAYKYVQKIADEMLWDSEKKEIDYEDALYYYNKLKEATKMVYNSFIGDDNYDPYEDGNVVLRG